MSSLTRSQAESAAIITVLVGSHVHGLNVPPEPCEACRGVMGLPCTICSGAGVVTLGSDRDEEAIVIEPLEAMVNLGKPFEDLVIETPEVDRKYTSLRKWCRLACKGNPNALLTLFAPLSSIITQHALGGQLRELAPHFVSKQAIKAHLGYLQGQRSRMLNHQKAFAAGGGHGKPRFDLVARYGYDTKFAMHLLRLSMQGIELATTGRLTLPMAEADRELLLGVRRGQLSLDEVLRRADALEQILKASFDACTLPDEPNVPVIEAWMQRAYFGMWMGQRYLTNIRWIEEMGLLPIRLARD